MKCEIAHAIPGRLRFIIPDIKDNYDLADNIAGYLLSKEGIGGVRVNTACSSVVIEYDTKLLDTRVPARMLRGLRLESVNGKLSASYKKNGNGRRKGFVRGIIDRIMPLILPTVTLGLSLAKTLVPHRALFCLVAVAAAPIYRRTAQTLGREKRLGVDFLDAAAVSAMALKNSLPTCAFMAWLISIGEHIREETARKSQKAIADLVRYHSDIAVVQRGRKRVRIPVSLLSPGDLVIAHAGDYIPVDGEIVSGKAGVNLTSLTGESILSDTSKGDEVFAGSVVMDGELTIRAVAVGLQTRAGQIVKMLRDAPVNETKIEDYAARFADRLVLPTMAASGMVFAVTRNFNRSLSTIIVDFGTGIRVAAPTAFLSSMTLAAQQGIVIKGGRSIEKLASIDTILFDKTGTLTTGTPAVKDIVQVDNKYSERKLIEFAATAESGLNHPLASALAAKAEEMKIRLRHRIDARLKVGLGVKAVVDGKRVMVGSKRMMLEEGIDISIALSHSHIWESSAKAPLYIAVEGKIAGIVTYADRIRPESRRVIMNLRQLGVSEIVMVTGDREEVAMAACEELKIDRCFARVFPDKKLEILRRLQEEGKTVAVVGDGINDSLALAHADVAIAPYGSTDAAKEAADVLLMHDNLELLVQAVSIARSAIKIVKQSYKIVAFPNAGAIALAIGGLLGPPGATLINNGTTVAAAINGLRPLFNGKNGRDKNYITAVSNTAVSG